jgi:chromosome segregation ATPase
MADFYIEKLQRISKRRKVPVRSYECDACGLWHLTSQLNPLETRVIQLQEQIEKLKKENKLYRIEIGKLKETPKDLKKLIKTDEQMRMQKDERVKELLEQTSKQGAELTRLRKDNKDLIVKIVQMEKLLPGA